MGKSTAGKILESLDIPVHDADGAVHRAFAKGSSAITDIEAAFPGVVENGEVNRLALGTIVFNDISAIRLLENILHPLVRADRERFVAVHQRQRRFAIAFDVPLLFETNTDQECDITIVVTAPSFIQAYRVLGRPGMTVERLQAIRERQMPDSEKRRRAGFVVPTNLGKRFTVNKLRMIIGGLRAQSEL
tara:strand:- start:118 stop:684 length:567 start_codon:yes stop_codon:yes gene_type:complete